MMKKLLIIGCSVRCCAPEERIVHQVKNITNEPDLYEYIEQVSRSKEISNSEGGGIAVSYGAQTGNVELSYLSLNTYINKKGKISRPQELLDIIAQADGYVFLTPVYFGDRSSLLFDLFALMKQHSMDFNGNVSAVVSVGAKRNGGQETTNIYTLYNLMQMKSLAVGNGPPTSQYGGTLVGGNKGTMDNDYFGIMTAMGVGTKMAKTLELNSCHTSEKPNITFWILEDMPDRRFLKYLESKLPFLPRESNWKILDILDYDFNQCIACNRCPNLPKENSYRCVINDDDMQIIQQPLLESDGIVLCGINYIDESDKLSNYQRFLERTRYIRRANFLLTDRPFMTLSLNEMFADLSYDLKAFTAFIRHNTIAHRGVQIFDMGNEYKEPVLSDIFSSFASLSAKSVTYRRTGTHKETVYEAIGYESKWG